MLTINDNQFNFHNSYLALPESLYSKIQLNPVKDPNLVILNEDLVVELGLSIESLKSNEGVNILSGNIKVQEGAYIAQGYAGHQFGHFTILGDGRAVLIGEHITPNNKKYDIQLKGSGITPYSRGGDGRAALGPMLREYIISEAMYNLHVPTTRSLAVVTTGENVLREKSLKGAILTRIASSHIRFGTFQYAYNNGGKEVIKKLADYCIERHYPSVANEPNRYLSFLKEVILAHANLVAKWQSIGFIHGVMNTDNMTISGETIDYGPCAFMDIYNPNTVFSSIDLNGRYSYKNQPKMAHWNLCRFAETLIPLVSEDSNIALGIVQEAINEFVQIYEEAWLSNMKGKLGIMNEHIDDKKLVEELLLIMEENKLDFTNTFIELTISRNIESLHNNEDFNLWLKKWKERLNSQNESYETVEVWMKNNNPVVIPRNHKVEEALATANNGDFSSVNNLLNALSNPYDYSNNNNNEYQKLPENIKAPYRTFCGT